MWDDNKSLTDLFWIWVSEVWLWVEVVKGFASLQLWNNLSLPHCFKWFWWLKLFFIKINQIVQMKKNFCMKIICLNKWVIFKLMLPDKIIFLFILFLILACWDDWWNWYSLDDYISYLSVEYWYSQLLFFGRGSERRRSEHRKVRTSKVFLKMIRTSKDQNVKRSECRKSERRKERRKSLFIF